MLYQLLCSATLFAASLPAAPSSCTAPSATTSISEAPSNALDLYFHYLDIYSSRLGPFGNADQGEIEIVRDREKIAEIEKMTGRQAGVIAQDKYWIWINDPVKFPNGKYGIYGRFLWVITLENTAGVAVMPILPNGKIALNRNYRHATRSWEYELPRGKLESNESPESGAMREVKEETGMILDTLHRLGDMAVDSGFTNSVVPIFLAKVAYQEEAVPEDSEAIASIDAFSIKELKQGYKDGYLTINIEGKPCKVNVRDSFLAYALLQAELHSLLPNE